jgi:hypothetical protein
MNIRYKYKEVETIQYILENCQTIAVVGHSSRQERAGYYVPAYMQQHGYRIIPVNPNLESSLGEKAYTRLSDVPKTMDLVLIFRRSEAVPPLVDEAIQIGAKAVWMQLGIVNVEAAKTAEEAGLKVVMNACMMVEHRRLSGTRVEG